jgi:hypothetical protein
VPEILGLWEQYKAALVICRNTMLPVFLATVLGCYCWAKVSVSAQQSVASSGLLLLLTFCLVMGSYTVVLVPFILASDLLQNRFFTGTTDGALYGRLILLVVIGAIVAFYYGIIVK